MKQIDKDAVIRELNRLIAELVEEGEGTMFEQGRISAFEDAKLFINSLEEKKVEEKFERPSIKIENSECVGSRMKYIDEDLKPIAKFIFEFAHWNLHKDEWNHPVLEVPLFRVLDALIQRGKPYNETCKDCETSCPNFDEAQGTNFVRK